MKSQQEIIKILEENGIRVIMKPVAIFDEHGFCANKLHPNIIEKEMDIYEAYRKLTTMKLLSKDPFS